MKLRTLHSDLAMPGQVLAVYACPDCGYERRLPIVIRPDAGDVSGHGGFAPMGAW